MRGEHHSMTAPSYMAYTIIGGVLLASLLAPLIIGADGWIVPLVVLPFCVVYALVDRRLRRRQEHR